MVTLNCLLIKQLILIVTELLVYFYIEFNSTLSLISISKVIIVSLTNIYSNHCSFLSELFERDWNWCQNCYQFFEQFLLCTISIISNITIRHYDETWSIWWKFIHCHRPTKPQPQQQNNKNCSWGKVIAGNTCHHYKLKTTW